jgi:ferredoxin-nitrate reductase
VAGLDQDGMYAFRTLADARQIIAAAAPGRRAVVIGGGLLGLEAARGLRARGVAVTVVHAAGHLMERQLDPPAAALLGRTLRELDITLLLDADTTAVAGSGSVCGVVLADGTELPAEMVVVAAGVVPDVELARDAGLEVQRAIVVDDELRTSAPGVYAVGECAQHRDVVYGLWAPLLEQAKVAGASLAGVPAAFRGVTPATTLKVAGTELFCGGRATTLDDDDEIVALDSRRGRYRRLLLADGRLVGAVLLGDLSDAPTLRWHLATGERLPESLLEPLPGGAALSAVSADDDDPGETVCTCMSVTRGEVTVAIESQELDTVDQIAASTRAGSGCGTCRQQLAAMLEAARAAA